MYLERRRRLWYALHDIPADVQKALGRRRYVKSMETEERRIAERRAAVWAVRWRSEIEKARTGNGDHVERDAMFWRKALQDAPDGEQPIIRALIADEARERLDKAAAKLGIMDERDPRYDELPEHADTTRFFSIATGKLVRFNDHLDEHLAAVGNTAKTLDMKRSSLTRFAEEFRYVTDVERKVVQRWANQQVQDGKKPKTLRRMLSELRGYWSYLQSIGAAPENALPFEKLSIPKLAKNGKEDERKPFAPEDVVKLLNAAKARDDGSLADLIELGMWTGARIEELCALRVEKARADVLEIEDAKTAAGWRQVPVHSNLKATLRRLLRESKDGYVLSGLTANKYGDRSNAVGKRFGRLKASLGFGEDRVFHSIRRTVATLLEDASVPESVSADILGHDKPTMTYGLYSGGASLETKRKAIEKLHYT